MAERKLAVVLSIDNPLNILGREESVLGAASGGSECFWNIGDLWTDHI
jgi:hypothetical protein